MEQKKLLHPSVDVLRVDGTDKEAVEIAKEAALVVPQIRYIGWDICVTPNGPAIIEGNTYPGYDFWQLPEHTPDKIGLYPYFRKMVPEYK